MAEVAVKAGTDALPKLIFTGLVQKLIIQDVQNAWVCVVPSLKVIVSTLQVIAIRCSLFSSIYLIRYPGTF
jgi:hypothetical protein